MSRESFVFLLFLFLAGQTVAIAWLSRVLKIHRSSEVKRRTDRKRAGETDKYIKKLERKIDENIDYYI